MNGFHLPYDRLPRFLPCPETLLTMDMSITECRVYMLLLRRSFFSARSERWVDADGRVFLYYPIRDLALALRRSATSVKKALNALEEKDLILRLRQGAGKPNRIYVKFPMEEDPYDPETDAGDVSGMDTLPSSGGDTGGVPRMDGKVTPIKKDREERKAEDRGRERSAPVPASGEHAFLPGEAGDGTPVLPQEGEAPQPRRREKHVVFRDRTYPLFCQQGRLRSGGILPQAPPGNPYAGGHDVPS